MGSFVEISSPASPFPWQSKQWENIKRSHEFGRLPHALLLTGPQGIGKQQFAAAMVDRVLCQNLPQEEIMCGVCKSCRLRVSGNHPDMRVIERQEKKKNISIEQIREMTEFLSNQAQMDGYRCVVINGANDMSESAANALLKVLEEPGSRCILILISDRAGSLLPTIKSRCQHITFCTPSKEAAMQWLIPHVSSLDRAEHLLNIAEGAPLKALSALQWTWLDQRPILAAQMVALRLSQVEPLQVAKVSQDIPPTELLLWLYQWCLDMVKLSQRAVIDNEDLSAEFAKILAHTELESIFKFSDEIFSNYSLLAQDGNPNILLMMESIFISWANLP